MATFPKKIICLTEESVETLYALGKQDLIAGVSAYVKRPPGAKKNHPITSVFTHANLKKIAQMKPDLVLGHSDIQKDIARDLIELGLNVFIANHRSLSGILDYIVLLGSMVGARQSALNYRDQLEQKLFEFQSTTTANNPKVYFEEWDDPMITGIQWVSELIQHCGGKNIFASQSQGLLAKERVVTSEEVIKHNPDIIFGCWCGKKVELESFSKRSDWDSLSAIKHQQVFELAPEIFLQPGPAVFEDGLRILHQYFNSWKQK